MSNFVIFEYRQQKEAFFSQKTLSKSLSPPPLLTLNLEIQHAIKLAYALFIFSSFFLFSFHLKQKYLKLYTRKNYAQLISRANIILHMHVLV